MRGQAIANTLDAVEAETKRAVSLHGPMKSAHEAYGVILEELDEFWDEVKKKKELRDKANMRKELIQVAAMAIRAIADLEL
jgi:hypothetical protein